MTVSKGAELLGLFFLLIILNNNKGGEDVSFIYDKKIVR